MTQPEIIEALKPLVDANYGTIEYIQAAQPGPKARRKHNPKPYFRKSVRLQEQLIEIRTKAIGDDCGEACFVVLDVD